MQDRVDARRWAIVVLAFTAIMLNYVDRQVIALLKPMLQSEFGWNDRDYSHMASAFQFAAAIAFLGTGWFIDRVGLRIGFAAGVFVWSLAGMAHAFVSGVSGFIGARVVLGAAESIGTPAAVKSAATYFGPKDRSIALGIGNTAPNVGAVITPLVIPALAIAFGWRAAFLVAWRTMRDRYYDEALGNRNWDAVRRKYEEMAGECLTGDVLGSQRCDCGGSGVDSAALGNRKLEFQVLEVSVIFKSFPSLG